MIVLFVSVRAGAAMPLEGYWKRKLTCESYPKEPKLCGEGPQFYGTPDFFELGILVRGNLACGVVVSSSNLNHKIDTSYFIGSIEKNRAKVVYGSSHAEESLRGLATVQVSLGRLRWRVLEPLETGYMWRSTDARPSSWPKGLKTQVSAWCKAHWEQIEDGSRVHVDLRID